MAALLFSTNWQKQTNTQKQPESTLKKATTFQAESCSITGDFLCIYRAGRRLFPPEPMEHSSTTQITMKETPTSSQKLVIESRRAQIFHGTTEFLMEITNTMVSFRITTNPAMC